MDVHTPMTDSKHALIKRANFLSPQQLEEDELDRARETEEVQRVQASSTGLPRAQVLKDSCATGTGANPRSECGKQLLNFIPTSYQSSQ